MSRMERKESVLKKLEELNIKYELISHPPIPTIEEAMVYWKDLKGIHCKNLFMRNHKGDKHYLILFDAQMQIAIHDLEKILKQGKLSFASPQRMEKYLAVEPGSVSPFGLINDQKHEVIVFIDKKIVGTENLTFHPNDNRYSISISNDSLFKFLEHQTNKYEILDLY